MDFPYSHVLANRILYVRVGLRRELFLRPFDKIRLRFVRIESPVSSH